MTDRINRLMDDVMGLFDHLEINRGSRPERQQVRALVLSTQHQDSGEPSSTEGEKGNGRGVH